MTQICFATGCKGRYYPVMPSVVRRKKQKSEDQILDEATARLLRGIKKHEEMTGKVVTSEQMRKQGYSERFISKMEQA